MKLPARMCAAAVFCWAAAARGDEPRFERVVVDDAFPGAYQVEAVDVNGDGKVDIVAVGGGTCAWYENPRWTKRIVTSPSITPGIISSATADLDGDGRAEVAIGYDFEMNEPKRGKLLIARQGQTLEEPWQVQKIGDVPSVHRLRWVPAAKGRRPSRLVVAPIFGSEAVPPSFQDAPAKIQIFEQVVGIGAATFWSGIDIGGRLVTHSVEVHANPVEPVEGLPLILTADNEGVALLKAGTRRDIRFDVRPLIPGLAGTAPKRGSSEVHLGKLSDGRRFLATIDPWHGSQVAVCLEKKLGAWEFESRVVLDESLDDGHALCVVDVDRDGNDEVVAGHRGKDHRVSIYRLSASSGGWQRTVLDRGVAAQDVRPGDVDGDGAADFVAVGGSTHNVVLYRNLAGRR